MKTKIKFLAMMLMGVVLSTNVWGETYTKVTSAPTDWSGEYLLVYESSETEGLAWTGVDAGQCHDDVTISNGTITNKPEAAVTLIIASMTGGYSIKVTSGTNKDKYINQTSYANGLGFSENASANTLSISEGTAVITGSGNSNGSYVTMRYNNTAGVSNERFRYYKSGQQAIALYKKEATCTTDLDAPVVTATPGNGSATLTWATVAYATKYQVSWNGDAFADATSPYIKPSLSNGTTYTWKVKAIGGGIYCDSEAATGKVTPSANRAVTWKVDGEAYTAGSPSTSVANGSKVTTLPTPPDAPPACDGSVFVGWTASTTTNFGNTAPSDLFKTAADAPVVTDDVTYHAVFAEED